MVIPSIIETERAAILQSLTHNFNWNVQIWLGKRVFFRMKIESH